MSELKARSVELLPIREKDIPLLHAWRNSKDFRVLCSTRRNEVTIDQFTKELQKDMEKDGRRQFVVSRRGVPVGTIYSYQHNCTDGHAFVSLFLEREARRAVGVGPLAFVLLIVDLFKSMDLHKVYFEIYSYNIESLSNVRKAKIFEEEGVFREHRLIGGERYDLVRMAVYRNQLPKLLMFLGKK